MARAQGPPAPVQTAQPRGRHPRCRVAECVAGAWRVRVATARYAPTPGRPAGGPAQSLRTSRFSGSACTRECSASRQATPPAAYRSCRQSCCRPSVSSARWSPCPLRSLWLFCFSSSSSSSSKEPKRTQRPRRPGTRSPAASSTQRSRGSCMQNATRSAPLRPDARCRASAKPPIRRRSKASPRPRIRAPDRRASRDAGSVRPPGALRAPVEASRSGAQKTRTTAVRSAAMAIFTM